MIVYVQDGDGAHLEDVSFWLTDQAPRTDDRTAAPGGHLLPLTAELGRDAWGGAREPTSVLWAGTLNHVELDGLLSRLCTIPWKAPEAVQVFARDDGDPWFRLYMLREGRMRQYSPAPAPEELDRPW